MKKIFLFAALLLASALTVSAQMPTPLNYNSPEMSNQGDPQQLQMIQNAQANRRQSNNNKNKPHLKATDLNLVCQETDMQGNDFRDCSGMNQAYNKYNFFLNLMKKAKREKAKAEEVLAKLPGKQQRETAKIQEKMNKCLSNGKDQGLWQKLESEKQNLEQKHIRQKAQAMEKLEKAIDKYNKVERNLELASNEWKSFCK